ncbi:MAG: 1-phosphofructokinase family hexose kinase [Kofleriaceae bacterium]|nr:1-phosphofructokinase family hexose kinase [Kofleriaceae bacterium]
MSSIVTITLNPALDESFGIDRLLPERKLRCSPPVIHPGGGGINVARVAARLDAEVFALWIGGGPEGQMLADLLEGERIRHVGVPAPHGPRRSFHVSEHATGAFYRFVLPGPELTEEDGARVAAELERCGDADLVVISGSLPPTLRPDTYARLAAQAAPRARVVLDTSGEALARGLAGDVYLAKPNRNELARLVGRELGAQAEVVSAARTLITAGRVEVVAVSLGSEGLHWVTREDDEHIAAPEVTPVSAVGAGDSTVAGIVVGLARGLPLPAAMRLGVAAGTAAVMTPGTDLCRAEDVARLYDALPARTPAH